MVISCDRQLIELSILKEIHILFLFNGPFQSRFVFFTAYF